MIGSRFPLPGLRLRHGYAALPPRFHAAVAPTPVAMPRLLALNEPLAARLGLSADALRSEEGVAILAGNAVPEGALPLAQAYAGHQFGSFTPRLGDGRAILLGEIVAPDGMQYDMQLKGAGRTPYSRGGDGRAAIGPVLREYLVSEAMASLGIPTTRALAAVATGEDVYRDVPRPGPQPGAVLTRIASGHVRIGTFQYFAAQGDLDALRILTDHAIARHYPDAALAPCPALALLRGVIARQAALVAAWLCVGFVHGVMNTDNTSLSGETIDYGPCAFLDAYDPAAVFSAIDHHGRYAFANQPGIAHWNLARLAETLLPLLAPDDGTAVALAQEALAGFAPTFQTAWHDGMRRKLGIGGGEPGDDALIRELLAQMATGRMDYTRTFGALCGADRANATRITGLSPDWLGAWHARCARDDLSPEARRRMMLGANPVRIPRNRTVETALAAAMSGDMLPFRALLAAVTDPYGERREDCDRDHAMDTENTPHVTYCGT